MAVVGGGSWGTTVAHLVSHNALTKLWCRDSEVAASINHYHKTEINTFTVDLRQPGANNSLLFNLT